MLINPIYLTLIEHLLGTRLHAGYLGYIKVRKVHSLTSKNMRNCHCSTLSLSSPYPINLPLLPLWIVPLEAITSSLSPYEGIP